MAITLVKERRPPHADSASELVARKCEWSRHTVIAKEAIDEWMSGIGHIAPCLSCMAGDGRRSVTVDGNSSDSGGTGWGRGVIHIGNKGDSVGLGVGKGAPLTVAAMCDFSVAAGAVAKGCA